ncbi:MAG: SDR family NAD(P)-dependent oxidoreductase [Clostridia bacterium]
MTGQTVRAIVTGAGRGIGLATARRLIEGGARVAVLAQHAESAEHAASLLGAAAMPFSGDLADPQINRGLMQAAADALGGVDILVNNAGWTLTQSFLGEDEAYWERVLRVNLHAVIWAVHAILPRMVEGGGGSIVNVVSDAGRVGMQGEAVYAAAKGGVVALSKSLAQEMARHKIRVNCVAPGPTNTRVLEENMGIGPDAQKKIESMIRRIPLRQVAEPDDVAAAIVFLAGDQSRQITGQVLSVSGGLTMV